MNATIEQQIAELAEAGRQKAAERNARNERIQKERQQEEARRHYELLMASGLPPWMVDDYLSVDRHNGDNWFTLSLPGCAPIRFVAHWAHGNPWYPHIRIEEPIAVVWVHDADEWIVSANYHTFESCGDLDEAIATAYDVGESWHAMSAEADRRNAAGLRPEPQPAPAPTLTQSATQADPDMIAQAGELLRRFQFGADLTNWTEPHVDRHDIVTGESAIVVASAILAVAGELRELRNVLADGLLSQLAAMDADNAALIARCRDCEPIEVPE